MTLDEILAAIENLEVADIVPVMEVVTAKLAEGFGYADAYAVPAEAPVEEAPVEEMPVEEMPVEEISEEDMRLAL